ncbi:MAG: hypothetical protein EA424_21185 [Planctomycetaceae bacterium]|nr:MAG: hypothetical protein EA424_21185 [Planctomycetaceae bacterium]
MHVRTIFQDSIICVPFLWSHIRRLSLRPWKFAVPFSYNMDWSVALQGMLEVLFGYLGFMH